MPTSPQEDMYQIAALGMTETQENSDIQAVV